MGEDLQPILRQMSERLSRIEQALSDQPNERYQKWLSNHEDRIRAAEIKINVLWIGAIVVGGFAGYWLQALL